METPSTTQAIERKENESTAEYLTRLYEAVMGQSSSMDEALRNDPVNFSRMVNQIPTLLKELAPPAQK